MIFVKRESVQWGGFSQIKTEFILLEAAVKGMTVQRELQKTQSFILKLQSVLDVDRTKGKQFYKGSQWFSVTAEFFEELLSKKLRSFEDIAIRAGQMKFFCRLLQWIQSSEVLYQEPT